VLFTYGTKGLAYWVRNAVTLAIPLIVSHSGPTFCPKVSHPLINPSSFPHVTPVGQSDALSFGESDFSFGFLGTALAPD